MTVSHRIDQISRTMGSTSPAKDHVLVAFFRDLPTELSDAIHSRFPDADVSIVTLPMGETIPAGVYLPWICEGYGEEANP